PTCCGEQPWSIAMEAPAERDRGTLVPDVGLYVSSFFPIIPSILLIVPNLPFPKSQEKSPPSLMTTRLTPPSLSSPTPRNSTVSFNPTLRETFWPVSCRWTLDPNT